MPRIEPLERDEAPEEARKFYDLDEERYGYVLNNTKLYAYNVPVLETMKAVVGGYMATTALPIALKSLVRVRIALLNDCPFCADLHSSVGMNGGVTGEQLQALGAYESSPHFAERERLALEYADAITLSDADVDDELFGRVRAAFTEAEIIELTFTVAVENFFSKFHHALLVEAQGFCPVALPAVGPASASA
jgi:AhpD family alkylhydroperoxidase